MLVALRGFGEYVIYDLRLSIDDFYGGLVLTGVTSLIRIAYVVPSLRSRAGLCVA